MGVNDFWMKDRFICNSLIITPRKSPRNCRGISLFVFNSIASLCRKVAAGRDGFVKNDYMQGC